MTHVKQVNDCYLLVIFHIIRAGVRSQLKYNQVQKGSPHMYMLTETRLLQFWTLNPALSLSLSILFSNVCVCVCVRDRDRERERERQRERQRDTENQP